MSVKQKKKAQILIDVGSSTVKVYKKIENRLTLLFTRSLSFKVDFDSSKGLSITSKQELFELVDEVKLQNKSSLIKIFATALFRELTCEAKIKWVDEFYLRTGLFFNIISHDLENYALETALVGKYDSKEPILLVNIGGGSIELAVMFGREAIERKNISLGIGNILKQFEGINSEYSIVDIEKVVEYVVKQLPNLDNNVKTAIYNGGELTYMRLAGYQLTGNNVFSDKKHPCLIDIRDFQQQNAKIFKETSLNDLENLMPQNPKWMHGARGCSAIAQSIFQKYKIKTIVPSDSNLIDGLSSKEYRYVTISGSFRKHLKQIVSIRNIMVDAGITVLSPRFVDPKNPKEEFVVFAGEEGSLPLELERYHLNCINMSDALIVVCPDGYVGASALMEIGYAHSLGKRIIFTEEPQEFILKTLPCEIGL